MKKLRILTSALLLSSVLSTSSVFAAETTTVNNANNLSNTTIQSQCIPGHMAPGTVIKFNQDKKMEVIKQGKETKTSTMEKNAAAENLPTIKANMTVTYDVLGGAIVVSPENEIDNSNISVEMKEVTNSNQRSISRNSQSGKVSWFNADSSDGAAHKTIKLGTWVDVNDNDTDNSTSVKILSRGPFVSGRILAISKETFNSIDDTDNDTFNGSISW